MTSITRCLYEVLEVERTVPDKELKRAYRKAAIRWHPDKNLDNIEEATKRFRQVQEVSCSYIHNFCNTGHTTFRFLSRDIYLVFKRVMWFFPR
jgi:DnaJ domain